MASDHKENLTHRLNCWQSHIGTNRLITVLKPHLVIRPFSFHRNTRKAAAVTLVIMVTTHWSIETPWAAYRVRVTSVVLCQRVYATCGPDNARVETGWREHSAPTVPKTTTTGVQTSRVRQRRADVLSYMQDYTSSFI